MKFRNFHLAITENFWYNTGVELTNTEKFDIIADVKIKNERDDMKARNEEPRWEYLNGTDWAMLLCKQPQFADKCDWSKLSGIDWAILLVKQPRFADKCDWTKFGGREWAYLLGECPQFADKCDWRTLNGNQWAILICDNADFAEFCDWSKLTGRDWMRLICARPEFADRCDYSTFSNGDIIRLALQSAKRAPQLAKHIEKCDLKRLTASGRDCILEILPELAPKFEAMSHDYAADKEDESEPADDVYMVTAEEFFKEREPKNEN